ncbi:MAG: xanthine dehydrogenase family protein molybdopterin-binding subunit [bacterium]|nr:xanthine dehydrogenase family protein molybdopterin-binding subunit [bacterium]
MRTGAVFGRPVLRREDSRFLKGEGVYVPDVRLPDAAEAVVKRSPHAHALIEHIDISEAAAAPGVVAVITADDLTDTGVYRPYHKSPPAFANLLRPLEKGHDVPLLAAGRVRRVGEPVALVVAEDRYLAEDAARLIRVDYEPLEPVLDSEAGLRPEAPVIHDELGDNVQSRVGVVVGDPDGAMAAADHTAGFRFTIRRQIGSPLGPRAVLARFDPVEGLTVWSATQMQHLARKVIGGILGVAEDRIRVICPDMGGSFGGGVYYEDILIPYLARRVGRPVRWVEDRTENLVNARHARDQVHDVEVGFDSRGRLLALRDRILVDMGIANFYGLVVPYNTISHLKSQYRIDNYEAAATCVITNKTPNAPARGAGRVTAAFVIERVLERVARRLDLDPADVRRINLIPADAMPFDTGVPYRDGKPSVYDSGDFPAQLEMALEAIGYQEFRARQARLRAEGRHVGIGISAHMEGTGFGPPESAIVRVDGSGAVTILSGSNNHGQSHETTLAQVCADALGVAIETISLRDGDTALIRQGGGTFASRTAVTGSMAVAGAARKLRKKAIEMAARLHGVEVDGLTVIGGVIRDGAGARITTLAELAQTTGDGERTGGRACLEAMDSFASPTVTWASGTHVVTLEVDRDTGQVELERYVIAHDAGNIINPAVVEGQIVGGVVHGIGNALSEEAVYDEAGNLLSGSFVDYRLPRAIDVPPIEVHHQEFPSGLNDLGIKGCGEGGTVGAPAAIANAVEDALHPLDLRITEMPLQPEKLLRYILTAEALARKGQEA